MFSHRIFDRIDVKVVFQCTEYQLNWTLEVSNVVKKDRWISFKIPSFPYVFDQTIRVNVFVSQTNRDLGQCQYFYLSNRLFDKIFLIFYY